MAPSLNSIDTLLFDWDGTLLDSAQLGFTAFQKTFQDLGITFDRSIYEAIYSPNWYTMYEALRLSPDKWQTADNLWIHHYGEEFPKLVQGVWEAIEELRRKDYRLGLVSSGSRSRVAREIDHVGLKSIFQVVICNEDTVNKKPHPEGLEKAMQQLHSTRRTCCYIGDSPEDVQMGKNAQVFTVGIRSAYPGNERLVMSNPDIYLESITELPMLF